MRGAAIVVSALLLAAHSAHARKKKGRVKQLRLTFGLLLMVWTNGVGYAVRAGQTQTMCFGVSTAQLIVPPPFNKPNAPRHDVLNDDGAVSVDTICSLSLSS
jgi:hypothetical protein